MRTDTRHLGLSSKHEELFDVNGKLQMTLDEPIRSAKKSDVSIRLCP